MKHIFRVGIALALLTVLQLNFLQPTQACGPAFLSPVFDYNSAPERPWTDFASGKLGIVKPTFHRVVLYAAYRHLNGGALSYPEQQAVIETWEAHYNRKEPDSDALATAVKAWAAERKTVIREEEKPPEIYTERNYAESYDFFPNCSKNAFEVAKKTLADRALMYGSDSKEVKEWLSGQDKVFMNCANENQTLDPVGQEAPEWLRKDRDYQMAASAFYSTQYKEARERFEKIAADNESPWREVSDYLVARAIVRQASLGESADAETTAKYQEAEDYLNLLIGRSTTYNSDARRLMNLVKYRLHPQERLRELAQKLPAQNDGEELRQDLIDYTWLLDQFESEALVKEENRKAEEEKAKATPTPPTPGAPDPDVTRSDSNTVPPGILDLNTNANMAGNAVANSTYSPSSGYSGGYYGNTSLSLAILPEFLGEDALTEWLFTFQIQNDDSYFHSVNRWRQTGSDMWLMTAMTKAKKDLGGFKDLMEAAKNVAPSSPAFYTVMYHQVRLLMETGNKDEARKLLDKILHESLDMPISTRNLFTEQRLKVSNTLSEFLQSSIRKPFGFSYEDETARSIDEIVAERKSWYNPEYYEESQAQYEFNIDQEFASKRVWQDKGFFDENAVDTLNLHFPTSQLIEVLKNPDLPVHLKRRLTIAIWTRAYLLKNEKIAFQIAPEVVKLKPEIEPLMTAYLAGKTPAERETSGLFMIVKDGEFTPYLSGGFDFEPSEEFDIWQDDRWWCEQYDYNYDNDGNEVPKGAYVPPFLTPQMLSAAKTEKAALNKTEDAVAYLTRRVMAWAQAAPADKRLPEALYVVFQSNHWVKYGCGNYSEETREKAFNILKTRYPRSKWTQKAVADKAEDPN